MISIRLGEIVDPRLADAARDVVDVGERLGSLLAVDHVACRLDRGYDPAMPRVATSSAIAETAAASLTMPM